MGNTSPSDTGTSESECTRLAILDWAVRCLEEVDRSAPRRTAEWLLSELLECDRAHLYAHAEQTVAPGVEQQFREMVERRAAGEPLQHILGHTSFYGLSLKVSPAVMVPRPETERVVERALTCVEDTDAPRVLDAGTGSGCIALALKTERPDATVFACDVSTAALSIARDNAEALGLDIHLLNADVTEESALAETSDQFDLLVSNPPYIPRSEADSLPTVVRDYDPDIALIAGDDPLRFYRSLAALGRRVCVSGASVVFEVHAEYGEDVVSLLEKEAFSDVRAEKDLSGRTRVVWACCP